MNNYKKTGVDNFVAVYKKGNDFKVFGMSDTVKYDESLKADGYKHVDTLRASFWIESLLNGDVFASNRFSCLYLKYNLNKVDIQQLIT